MKYYCAMQQLFFVAPLVYVKPKTTIAFAFLSEAQRLAHMPDRGSGPEPHTAPSTPSCPPNFFSLVCSSFLNWVYANTFSDSKKIKGSSETLRADRMCGVESYSVIMQDEDGGKGVYGGGSIRSLSSASASAPSRVPQAVCLTNPLVSDLHLRRLFAI